ncbi:MAG: hypothetical protein M1823_003764 [Watsoniomyces obsoletus]|nr:MAG: hypothetical protein M1823_003764 [Watsoniomyces obsoletus]
MSKSVWRAYLRTILFATLSIVLLGIAVLSYGLFYANYLPQVNVERVVHLQHGQGHPYGMASLDDQLVSKQRYDVVVHLELPRAPQNVAAGNFMLDLQLLPGKPASTRPIADEVTPIARSRRTAVLTYTSPMVDLASTVTSLPLVLLGWKRETEQLRVPMMEIMAFSRGAGKIPQGLYLEVQADEKLMIYDARVEFAARFTGIRSDGPQRQQNRMSDGTDSPEVSDTPRTFPTYSRQPSLRYLPTPRMTPDVEERDHVPATDAHWPAGEADDEEDAWMVHHPGTRADSGIGTSMEEGPSTSRVISRAQRRRRRGSLSNAL